MGTKGESNSIDALFGTIASNVLSKIECNTIVIPESAVDFNINEILFATDFHETKNFNYLSPLIDLLDKTDSNLAIVNVKEHVDFEMEPNKVENKIDELFSKYKHSHHYLEDENIELALFDFAHLNSCDLISISTRHYSLWKKIWHRSLAKQMALHSTIPVLVMHEK